MKKVRDIVLRKDTQANSVSNGMEIPHGIQAQWRTSLFIVCCILALMGALSEVIIYLIDSKTKELFLPLNVYRIRFIYLPSLLNIFMILLTYSQLYSSKVSNTAQNRWSCILIWFICANTQFFHYVYGPLLTLPCIAIFVSVLFADRKLTLSLSVASCVTITASCIVAANELRKGDEQLLTDMALALVIILAAYIGANLLIKYVRQQIEFILSGTQREKELLEKMQIDALMGIYNRSKMESVIEALVAPASERRKGLFLIMLDLDDFKKINDTYGHICGDKVLIGLAETIRQYGTRNIIPCRYGGEEIVIILKESTKRKTYDFCCELLRSFTQLRYQFSPDAVVSFSGGIAEYCDGMSRDEWIKLADDNLYQAKALGKNRVYPEYAEIE